MGISTVQWRCAIGTFFHDFCRFKPTLVGRYATCHASLRLVCMLALLFVMVGIETNPGPAVADVSRRLDELFTEIRAMRADLKTKIADCTVDLTLKMQAFEQKVVLFTAHLDAVERAQLAMRADINTLMSSSITGTGHSSNSAPVTTTFTVFATPTAVDDLVREID